MTFDEVLTKQLKTVCTQTFPVTGFKDTKPPYIVYDSPEPIEDKTLDGYMDSIKNDTDIYVVCETYTELKQKTKQVIDLIKGMELQEVEGIYFDEIKFEGKDQLYDKEGKQYVHVLNVIFYY